MEYVSFKIRYYVCTIVKKLYKNESDNTFLKERTQKALLGIILKKMLHKETE